VTKLDTEPEVQELEVKFLRGGWRKLEWICVDRSDVKINTKSEAEI
jgi:hypothetical protein